MSKIGSLSRAAIAVAMFGIVTLAPAVAQQAQTAGIVIFDLFTGGSVDLDSDEARKLLDAALFAAAKKMKAG